MKCSKCGKEMTNDQGECVVAFKQTIELNNATPSVLALFKENLGKYFIEGCQEYEWNFCYECILDMLLGVATAR